MICRDLTSLLSFQNKQWLYNINLLLITTKIGEKSAFFNKLLPALRSIDGSTCGPPVDGASVALTSHIPRWLLFPWHPHSLHISHSDALIVTQELMWNYICFRVGESWEGMGGGRRRSFPLTYVSINQEIEARLPTFFPSISESSAACPMSLGISALLLAFQAICCLHFLSSFQIRGRELFICCEQRRSKTLMDIVLKIPFAVFQILLGL